MAKDRPAAGKGGDGDAAANGRDWSKTLFLPETEFPMRAGLPDLEPRLLQRWNEIDLYRSLRKSAKGHTRFVLHDGPPYANGNIHIGHALNKILKDIVVKSQQMLGHDAPYVPGWDCHGLPIEWKIEEQYRANGKEKPDFSDPKAINAFRAECRAFAAKWLDVQREEFKRLGVTADWSNPYSTMAFRSEATIARELMAFASNGLLYRGSKPVMWSVVEKTALAEAEVEYQDYQSDMIWVKFPVKAGNAKGSKKLANASVVIWTTTPWTIPGNRAVSFSSRIAYNAYKVTKAPEQNWAKVGDVLILAEKLAADVMKAAKVEAYEVVAPVSAAELSALVLAHPLAPLGYEFDVPLLDGDHVTDDAGTGFVHTAPGHGADDYIIWTKNQKALRDRGIDTTVPFTVDADGVLTAAAPGLTGKRVLKENGDKGDANDAVIKALSEAGTIIARGRLKHQYPHSWRSKKPVIFRNTPQWFISMDAALTLPASGKAARKNDQSSLRERALSEIKETQWVPASGENRINGMIENRPDWVVSRQRAWGVPITVFRNRETDRIIPGPVGDGWTAKQNEALIARIESAFAEKGADVWFEADAKATFLDSLIAKDDLGNWEKVTDVLDVWFDSGCTHVFTLEDPVTFPDYKGLARKCDGGEDRVMYLEGSDQHRGWFHSSLLESAGTRGRAPYDVVLTHGFVLDEKGQKMAKSLGNVVAPQEVIGKSGADILRLWVAASDYSDDLRIGAEILKTFSETYRKLRNTIRWMLGALAHFTPADHVELKDMPELERLMLFRLAELDADVRKAYESYDFRKVVGALTQFMNTELSAFYFDIRKDALYCEPPSSLKRKAALTVVDQLAATLIRWLAPILAFTADEAWQQLRPDDGSVHLTAFPEIPRAWRSNEQQNLAAKWDRVREVRSVVTGALEIERAQKRMGSSLEAAPIVYVTDPDLMVGLAGVDMAEVCITSAITITDAPIPDGAFTLADVPGVGVVPRRADGRKCARSWRVTTDVGSDPAYPDLSARDAAAVREIDGLAASA